MVLKGFELATIGFLKLKCDLRLRLKGFSLTLCEPCSERLQQLYVTSMSNHTYTCYALPAHPTGLQACF